MSSYALPAGLWRREAMAEITRSRRMPQFLVPTVVTPGAFYALFALALNRSSPEAATVMLAGYGVFAATGPALFGFGAGVAMEREQGLIELKRVSPMPAGAYVAAKLAAAMFTTALAMALIDTTALIAGVHLSILGWVELTAISLASTLPFALLGFGLGMRMSGKGAVAAANALYLGSAILGGLWIPSSMLPGWMRTIGQCVPSYQLNKLAQAVVNPALGSSSPSHAAIVAGMTVALGIWAWTGWRRSAA